MPRKKKKFETPPSLQIEYGERTVDNPFFNRDHAENASNPRRIKVSGNIRESPIAWMYKHGLINEDQLEVGARFRKVYETCYGDLKAMNYIKEPVDGGGIYELSITDRKMDAAKALDVVRKLLGADGYKVVEHVCGMGVYIKHFTKQRRAQDKASHKLRECLDILAVHWSNA